MKSEVTTPKVFFRFSRPVILLGGVLFYTLGVGIARYLGQPILATQFWLGLAAIITLLLASHYLKAYYDLLDMANPLRRMMRDSGDQEFLENAKSLRQPTLLFSFSTLTAGAVLTVLLIAAGSIDLPILVILGMGFLIAFFMGVPPLRLAHTGFGELAEAVLMCNLIPAFAFMLQFGELHRLVPMLTFPLLALYLAARLALSFPHYSFDTKYRRRTALTMLGWQRGMVLHNLLIPLAYVLLAIAALIGLSWNLTWPALLTLPVGLFEIYQMRQIAFGAKPGWKLLRLTAVVLPALTAYLITIALWTS